MSWPVGGILSPGPLVVTGCVVIHLSGLPGDRGRASRPTLDLAPSGVCRAARVTPDAGALLPHRFTLTCGSGCGHCPLAVCFLWHFPAGRPDWPLASTLPYGVPTFLGQVAGLVAQPTHGRDHPASSLTSQCRRPRCKRRGRPTGQGHTRQGVLVAPFLLNGEDGARPPGPGWP